MNLVQQRSVESFCTWLNHMNEGTPTDHRYTVDDFDPKKNEYATFKQLGHFTDSYYPLMMLEVSDGDEGGPNILYVWYLPEEYTPWHMVQEFDTMISHVMYEGKLIKPPMRPTYFPS